MSWFMIIGGSIFACFALVLYIIASSQFLSGPGNFEGNVYMLLTAIFFALISVVCCVFGCGISIEDKIKKLLKEKEGEKTKG